MNKFQPLRLAELKTQASFLLKDLNKNSSQSLLAAKRFLIYPGFSEKTADWVLENVALVRLKHAYMVLALENGFSDWVKLRNFVIEKDCLYRPSGVAFVHAWFKNYSTAQQYFSKNGGYLLTFWEDFVVCGKEYITCLGLNNYAYQWQSIGYNWHQPQDSDAYHFLKEMAIKNYLSLQN